MQQIRLPSGKTVEAPVGISKEELKNTLLSQGIATEKDFETPLMGTPVPTEEMFVFPNLEPDRKMIETGRMIFDREGTMSDEEVYEKIQTQTVDSYRDAVQTANFLNAGIPEEKIPEAMEISKTTAFQNAMFYGSAIPNGYAKAFLGFAQGLGGLVNIDTTFSDDVLMKIDSQQQKFLDEALINGDMASFYACLLYTSPSPRD